MKLLSIAIPCYNSEDYMENCIKSLLPGGEDVEILIINDGSKVILSMKSREPGIKKLCDILLYFRRIRYFAGKMQSILEKENIF